MTVEEAGVIVGFGLEAERFVIGSPATAGILVPRRKIALGVGEHLDDFARTYGAQHWRQFARDEPSNWKYKFLELAGDPGVEVLFNLKGVDVWQGLACYARGAGRATDWELVQIRAHPEWWPRIRWLLDGVEQACPFGAGD